jgi:peroxiredoxin
MKMRWYRFVTGAVAVLALAVALPLFAGKYNSVVDIGAPMPEFSNLPAVDGSTLSSADLTEDAVVLVFLANHCQWVRGTEQDLIKVVGDFHGKSVRFVGVSVNHRPEDALEAMRGRAQEKGYNFTYVYDQSQELGRKLGATRTPEFFVFNQQRKLVYMGLLHNSPAAMRTDGSINYTRGAPADFYLKDAIQAVLNGGQVPVDETRPQGCSIEYAR